MAAHVREQMDDEWRARFKGDTDFAQIDSWMQAGLKYGESPEGLRRLCDLFNWMESDPTGGTMQLNPPLPGTSILVCSDTCLLALCSRKRISRRKQTARATKFVVTYECMPILMRIMEKYKERPLLSGVLCGCVAHAATAPECFPMLCTEDVWENLVAAFAKHVVPDNFSDTSVNRMQFTRLLVAPLANLTAEQCTRCWLNAAVITWQTFHR